MSLHNSNELTKDFHEKVAIVTGGAMGIGRACAEGFIARGGSVLIADIDIEAGEATANELGERAIFAQTDVCDMQAVTAMAELAVTRFGGIDILVNNAGQALKGVVDEITEEHWTRVIDINLNGYWRTMRVCIPEMKKRGGGSIVNMSSVQGALGFNGYAAYASAKGAINALTWQSAVDLAPHQIRVNAVAPGTIMTPLNEKLFASMDDPSELIDSWNKAHPLGRFGQADEVAETVLFLASRRASFITGDVVRVDGGLSVRGA
ncbi:SDR family NAD(P)-dependent oxidoreductase [Granulosicoccus antarcticus]|uniref:Dihydroanticapsin 7-dehydrogenase n=1 Tax=Granulosicoccus antarcticus IMCC3135 TaxID=1192854 RepID=A0A2Z2NK96_9GAMM|nr:SDR family NAD(P)-dependent oxidoreductase [Granulosicoccus antarcticus]ASJ71553.1 Dihydroanticapsin 7-dehydrogenase [Granulosicoccus antarcticus IMCC3135]